MSRGSADEHGADEQRIKEHRAARPAVRTSTDRVGTSRRGEAEAGGILAYDDFAITNDLMTGIPGRPSLRTAVGRRKKVWLVAAAVGLLLGIGLFKVMPPPYKATASVQIALVPGVLPTDEILTEVALAQSRTVAETAMRRIGIPTDPKSVQAFMGKVTVVASTDQVVTFTVKAASATEAVTRASAIWRAYLHVRNERLNTARQATLKALTATIAADKKRLAALTTKIANVQAEPSSVHQQDRLASLMAEKDQLTSALSPLEKAVRGFANQSEVSNQKVESGSSRLDTAQAAPRSKIKYPLLYAVGGLLAGLAIGIGWVIVSALVSTRPRRRHDFAKALGIPVRLSVGRIRVSRRYARRAPESAGGRGVQLIARYLRGVIPETRGRASLAIVAADDTIVPALAIVSVALSCVREGQRVIIADLTTGADAARMLGCTEPGLHRHVAGQRQLTVAIPEDPSIPSTGPIRRGSSATVPASVDPELEHAYHAADLLLTLVTVHPGLGADHLRSWAMEAVMILTAGRPSATKARTLAELIKLSGTALNSAVVVGADSSDDSLGVLAAWDGEPTERRDLRSARRNGSPGRSQAGPEQQERAQTVAAESRLESWPKIRTAAERPEARAEHRQEARPEPRLDARHEAKTQPRRVVDLRKVDSPEPEPGSGTEDPTNPERARPVNAPGPETMPYAEENVIGTENSSTWHR